MRRFPTSSLLRVPFHLITREDALACAQDAIREKRRTWACTPNPEMVVHAQNDWEFQRAIASADLILPDGVALFWAAEILKVPLVEKIAGIDFAADILKLAARAGFRVFFLGGEPGVAEKAAAQLSRQFYALRIAGVHHGYFSRLEEDLVLRKIRESNADILLVGIGFPHQEMFLYRHRDRLPAYFSIAIGGSFDIWSGRSRRAHPWFQRAGLEWLYRVAREPWRIHRQKKLLEFIQLVIQESSSL